VILYCRLQKEAREYFAHSRSLLQRCVVVGIIIPGTRTRVLAALTTIVRRQIEFSEPGSFQST
jgi:hypothetical protein